MLSCALSISSADNEDYEAQYQRLLNTCDPKSAMEKDFLERLHSRGLRLPDEAQMYFPGLYCQPDFHYEPDIWVFCDGTPHDKPGVKENDEDLRQRITAKGHQALVYYYKDSFDSFIALRPDIFRKVKE